MMNSKLAKVILWVLLLLGFLGVAKVSYENLTGSACPHIGFIPICYVVFGSLRIDDFIPDHSTYRL